MPATLDQFWSLLYRYRKPLLITLGIGAGIGVVTIAVSYFRRRKSYIEEVTEKDKVRHQRPVSNRILILGLDGSGKSSLLAMLTRKPSFSSGNGFHSVMLKSPVSGKMLEYVEVDGKSPSRQYWPKFTNSARVILVVVDIADVKRLGDLVSSLSVCIPEAKKLGAMVYFVLNKKINEPSNAEIEAEKFLCLEGLVKNPTREVCVVNLASKRPESKINKLEQAIEECFE